MILEGFFLVLQRSRQRNVKNLFVVHVGAQLHLKESRYNCKEHGRGCEMGKAVLCCIVGVF